MGFTVTRSLRSGESGRCRPAAVQNDLLVIDRRSRLDHLVGGSGGASAPHTPRREVHT
jgi:hypothetical protein